MSGDIYDIRYVRINASDLDHSIDFATKILGLQLVRKDSKTAYLRSDIRDHSICYTVGDARNHAVGWEVRTEEALDKIAAGLEGSGAYVRLGTAEECEQRRVNKLVVTKDVTGSVIDLVYRPEATGLSYYGTRDAGITHFSHVGMHTQHPIEDEKFWVRSLGAKVSDRIGDAALLRVNDVHHNLAFFPSKKVGIQHVNFQVGSFENIMKSYYFLLEHNVKIMFGPGRHCTSGAMFLYFQGPDDIVYEYSTGVRLITEEDEKTYQPRQFPMVASSFCMWGSRPDIPEFKAS